MKKIFALLLLLVAVTSSAQVRVISANEQSKTKTEYPYDSISPLVDFYSSRIRGYIGQELFLIPKTDYITNYFYEHPNFSGTKIEFSKYYGKTFVVDSVSEYNLQGVLYRYFLRLVEKESNDTVYYIHQPFKSSSDFLALGFKKKYEDTHKGLSYVYTSEFANPKWTDINTGETIEIKVGSIWTFDEIAISRGEITYIYKNAAGNVIDADPSDFITLKEYNNLIKKYGKPLCQKAISKTIAIGMPKELVRIAWGSPDRINDASYGDQWVYKFSDGTKYVYIKHGKVTGWN